MLRAHNPECTSTAEDLRVQDKQSGQRKIFIKLEVSSHRAAGLHSDSSFFKLTRKKTAEEDLIEAAEGLHLPECFECVAIPLTTMKRNIIQ